MCVYLCDCIYFLGRRPMVFILLPKITPQKKIINLRIDESRSIGISPFTLRTLGVISRTLSSQRPQGSCLPPATVPPAVTRPSPYGFTIGPKRLQSLENIIGFASIMLSSAVISIITGGSRKCPRLVAEELNHSKFGNKRWRSKSGAHSHTSPAPFTHQVIRTGSHSYTQSLTGSLAPTRSGSTSSLPPCTPSHYVTPSHSFILPQTLPEDISCIQHHGIIDTNGLCPCLNRIHSLEGSQMLSPRTTIRHLTREGKML